MHLREAMVRPPIFVYRETPLWRAVRAMVDHHCGFLPVVECGAVVGVVTSRDLATAVALEGLNPYSTPIEEVMTKPVVSLLTESDVTEAVETMHQKGVRRLVVTDKRGILRGVTSLDLIASITLSVKLAPPRLVDEISNQTSITSPCGWRGENLDLKDKALLL